MRTPNVGEVVILRKSATRSQFAAIEVGYEVEGVLLMPLRLGHAILMERHRRNDVWNRGIFISSPVVRLLPSRIVTENSTYELL